jgi:hypothetical protein
MYFLDWFTSYSVGHIASVSHMAANSTTWVRNTRIMLLRSREAQDFSRRTVGPTQPPIQSVPVFFPWCKAAECEVARWSPYRMSGAILLLPHVPSWLGHPPDQTNHWAHPIGCSVVSLKVTSCWRIPTTWCSPFVAPDRLWQHRKVGRGHFLFYFFQSVFVILHFDAIELISLKNPSSAFIRIIYVFNTSTSEHTQIHS